MRIRDSWRGAGSLPRVVALAALLGLLLPVPASAQKKDPAKGATDGGFIDGLKGDVPEGSAEMVTPETQRVIDRGLVYLSKQQNADGSFGNGGYHVAVTSLSGLAMMASGSSPGRGPYGPQIDRALGYVMNNTSAAGFICESSGQANSPMYGHGFGALFLAEAYGMTHRAEIREKLEKAVRLIVDTQNSQGGWRYQPVRSEADLSVTICQINALRAARNAGIYVPKATVENCLKYVRQSQNPDGGFRYQVTGGPSVFPRSAAGVVALYSVGDYDSKEVASGIAYLKRHMSDIKFGQRSPHYYYGHYYAVQAMWIRGGEDWNLWYPAIREELIRRQSAQGSWTDAFSNEYGTAMALIILQLPNSYLPIFQR